jgi:hypothetical protein
MSGNDTISKYDKCYGGVIDIGLATKPTTIEVVQSVTGRAESFIIQRVRTEHGDYLFIKSLDEDGLVRLALPPKVTAAIDRHGAALTKRNRSRTGKRVMAERMADGNWKPPVPPQRRKKA